MTGKRVAPNRGRGRPPGAKNRTTLFKEVIKEGFEKKLEKDFKRVLDTVVERAVKGDMKAAKMIMDRVVPVSRAVDIDSLQKGGLKINISVGSMEGALEAPDEQEAIEASFTKEEDNEQ